MKLQSPSLEGKLQGRARERGEVGEEGAIALRKGAVVKSLERLGGSSTSPCLERARDGDLEARWGGVEAREGHCLPNLLLSSAWMGCCSCAGSLEQKRTARCLQLPAR